MPPPKRRMVDKWPAHFGSRQSKQRGGFTSGALIAPGARIYFSNHRKKVKNTVLPSINWVWLCYVSAFIEKLDLL